MRQRVKKFKEIPSTEFLILREKLGLRKYRKTTKRAEEKRDILIELALKKISSKEKDDFIRLGPRRRKVKI